MRRYIEDSGNLWVVYEMVEGSEVRARKPIISFHDEAHYLAYNEEQGLPVVAAGSRDPWADEDQAKQEAETEAESGDES